MKSLLALISFALLSIGGIADARSWKSALTLELVSLGRLIELYHEREGKYPQSWEELEKANPDLDKTFSVLTPTRRMVLISPPLELPREDALAVAMTRDTYRPLSYREWTLLGTTRKFLKEPVYGVAVNLNQGGASRREIPPDKMMAILAARGLRLPEPSGLGPFPHEKQFRASRAFEWFVLGVLGFWLMWSLVRRIRRRRSASPSEKPS